MTASVSLLLPVYNEQAHIEACIAALRAQDHPGIVEILVAEGGSTDATPRLLAQMAQGSPPLVVVDNPDRNQAPGLNRLIERARGDVAVRIDAHTTYAPDYVSRCVAALSTSHAAMVGGPMIPQGETRREKAIAAAMSSPVGIGNSPYRRPDAAGEADTVYLGAFRIETLRALGGYRQFPSGVAEDTDLAYRVRATGGRVILDPAISSRYRPRSTYRSLWRQFWKYGRAKAEMLYANGRFPSWRPLAPLALILLVVAGIGWGAVTAVWWPLLGVLALWLGAVVVGAVRSRHVAGTALAILVMHASYGLGLGWGLLAGRGFVRGLAAMRGPDPGADPPTDQLDR
jgi:glycosyltransferase involved in cell wall biosynthesis